MTSQSTKQSLLHKNSTTKSQVALAIATALALPTVNAATFNVTEANDNGTGLIANTLSWAILQANTTAGADTIELNTDVAITGVMKRLIDSDTSLQSDATRRTIDGNSQFRPLFVKSGQVTIQDVDIDNGLARGGAAFRGGLGAGLGGAIFIYEGDVSLSGMNLNNSVAVGGIAGGSFGGGGMFGASSFGGGGLFAGATGSNGGYGGYSNYRNNDLRFGQGGDYSDIGDGNGGFGAGGGYGYYENGGNGGFGGGGGYSYYESGGDGGFGGGRGGDGGFNGVASESGYGASEQNAAGFGGGLFIRSGSLSIQNSSFNNNQAIMTESGSSGSPGSEGFGGAIFVMHTTQNSNGNNQGMPSSLPTVSGCGVVFTNNTADTDPDQANNNDDVFDLGNRITPNNGISLTSPCGPPDQEIQLTGNGFEIIDGDITPELNNGSDLGEAVVGFNATSQTFSIENLGVNFPLLLTADPIVSLTNNANNQFSISQQPLSDVVEPSGSLIFELTFTPSQLGPDTTTVVIENNDLDESPYEFVVQGTGVEAAPEIEITGNDIEIINGDNTPSLTDNTDLGVGIIGDGLLTKGFNINNIGSADLNFTNYPEVVTLDGDDQFYVETQAIESGLLEGGSDFFSISFVPTNPGIATTKVSIANSDSDENPYEFFIQAEAMLPPPEMNVYSENFALIEDGDNTPTLNEGTSFGVAQINGQTITKLYYIDNSFGSGDLILSGNPLVELQNNSGQFAVTTQPSTNTVAPNDFTTFEVTFTPTSEGLDTATVVIQNNDPDEAPYDFLIEGEGVPQQGILQVYDSGTPVDNFDFVFFDYVPVNSGQSEKTFEVRNIGFAPITLSTPEISPFDNEISITQNISDFNLEPNESTFLTLQFDPVNTGFSDTGTTLNLGYGNSGMIYFLTPYGYGQPTLTINAENNYLQEGDTASFVVTSDESSADFLEFSWAIGGDTTASDFGGITAGTGFVSSNALSYEIDVPVVQDGEYEGPEFFNIQISAFDPKLNIGFPSISGGVIDDDFIFDDGFEAAQLNEIIAAIGKYAFDPTEVPNCNKLACNFINSSFSTESEAIEAIDLLAWFEETLSIKRPHGDWDGDGLPNHHDLNPFGLDSELIEKIRMN